MTVQASSSTIDLCVATNGRMITFQPRSLVLAMFTGRDSALVQKHIDELAAEGVQAPETVPSYLELPLSVLTTTNRIEVSSQESSGEVEPVLLCTSDGWYVAVGSDHTARDMERVDLAESKKACAKIISTEVLPYDQIARDWDKAILRCWAGDSAEPYQEGSTRDITPIADLVAGLEATGHSTDGLVLFLGTVPLRNGTFEFASHYRVELAMGLQGPSIGCSYQVAIGDGS